MLPQSSPQSVLPAASPSPSTSSSLSDRPPRSSRAKAHRQEKPSNPKLARFRAQSKSIAEQQHDQAAAQKQLHTLKVAGKPATKRQISNKRSAEICRAAKGIYIGLLENDMLAEEQTQIDLMQQLLIQTDENSILRQRIKTLEKRLALVTSSQSWLTAKGFSAAGSNVNEDADFFLGAPGNEEMGRQREVEWILDADLETSHEQLEDVMDFQQSCSNEQADNETVHTAENTGKKTDYGAKEHSSPVAIFETAPEVPVADILKPSVSSRAAQS